MRIKSVTMHHSVGRSTSRHHKDGVDGCTLRWIDGAGLLVSLKEHAEDYLYSNLPGVKVIAVERGPTDEQVIANLGDRSADDILSYAHLASTGPGPDAKPYISPPVGTDLTTGQPVRPRRGRPPKVPTP